MFGYYVRHSLFQSSHAKPTFLPLVRSLRPIYVHLACGRNKAARPFS